MFNEPMAIPCGVSLVKRGLGRRNPGTTLHSGILGMLRSTVNGYGRRYHDYRLTLGVLALYRSYSTLNIVV